MPNYKVHKSVFGTEVKMGDSILYMYTHLSTYVMNYGTVDSIEFRPTGHCVLHVHCKYRLAGWPKGPVDKHVRLTTPTFFIVGSEVLLPAHVLEGK